MLFQLQLICSHFTMVGSREEAKWPYSNERFWPVGGGATLRSVLDCNDLPAVAPKSIRPGVNVFPFEIGNHASHVGLCSAYLREGGKDIALNQESNCISTNQAMSVDIPNVKCDHCVLIIKVAAAHLGPQAIEDYQSCLDVNISGNSSPAKYKSNIPVAAPPSPVIPSSIKVPATKEPSPPVGLSGPLPPSYPPPHGPNANAYTCSNDGKAYIADGYTMAMAQGTKCVQTSTGISVVAS
eukprot:NODE_31_length_32452_cov_0.352672.p17 type:complete len:239 gc:universal NODE_31_length_32452_cov_0.352672:32087-31371(-)